jgi:hypothetical protein
MNGEQYDRVVARLHDDREEPPPLLTDALSSLQTLVLAQGRQIAALRADVKALERREIERLEAEVQALRARLPKDASC